MVTDIDEGVAERCRRAFTADDRDHLRPVGKAFGRNDVVNGGLGVLARAIVVFAIQLGEDCDATDAGRVVTVHRRL